MFLPAVKENVRATTVILETFRIIFHHIKRIMVLEKLYFDYDGCFLTVEIEQTEPENEPKFKSVSGTFNVVENSTISIPCYLENMGK